MATALNRFRLQTLIYKWDHIHNHSSNPKKKSNVRFAIVTEPTNYLCIATTVTTDRRVRPIVLPVIRNHARGSMANPY